MDARIGSAGRGRDRRGRFVLVGLCVYALCAVWATWPAVRHLDGARYLARPAAGHGEAAAGDHLQLGWALWLTGHQLGDAESPLEDPYSFRPEASAPPNLQGWLLGLPFWPLTAAFGNVWAYNLVLLLSFVAAGGLTCWWLRALGLSAPAALVGGLVFALMPYRVGQSTGHLLGPISLLLPALLLALERRRLLLAGLVLVALPLSGQLHLALGAIPLALGYGWARLPRALWWKVAACGAAALATGLVVQRWAIAGSIGTGRSFTQVERYSAELSDLVTRSVGDGVEELVFVGWLVPMLALAGLWCVRRQRGLALVIGLGALVPTLFALGANLPGYELLWRVVPGLGSTRVPERLLPIACVSLAGLVGFAVDAGLRQRTTRDARSSASPSSASPPTTGRVSRRWMVALVTAVLSVGIAVDLRVPVFGAVAADTANGAYRAIDAPGRMLELPVTRPDIHYGSVYLAYARQSPRERPQGYSTLAPRAADRWARAHRRLSCGRGAVPAGIDWVVVHRGVYAQSGFFRADCPARAEVMLVGTGWERVARDGAITTWHRRPD